MTKLERARRFLRATRSTALKVVPLALLAASAHAGTIGSISTCGSSCGGTPVQLNYATQLTNMDMTVSGLVIPGGPNFAPVTVNMVVGLNPNQASLGHATATGLASGPGGTVATGDQFFVDSFFDVFFDISLTPTNTSNGLLFGTFGVGQTASLEPPFSAHMENQYTVTANTALPQDGLVPPPAGAPYIGHLNVAIPLPFIDPSDGLQYEFAFKLAQHNVDGQSATFITLPGGVVQDTMNSAGYLSAGIMHVGDAFDPPFTVGNQSDAFNGVGALTGPTSADSLQLTPEPASLLLLAGGVIAVALRRRLA